MVDKDPMVVGDWAQVFSIYTGKAKGESFSIY